MAPAHVLRVPRTDEEGSFVLVHTTQVRSKALDMKLVGTDGLAPYAVTIRHTQAASFMVKNCPVSEDEWLGMLASLLRQEDVPDLEVVATVNSESALVMTFRKRVRGITQRLGAIELKHDPDEEIELYDWCGLSARAYDQARETLASVTAKATELGETVAQLRRQLDELVDAKKADEAELLIRFRDLLNEKKVKIREQTALLAASAKQSGAETVKFEAVSEDEAPAPAPKTSKSKPQSKARQTRKAGTSRAAKRKQPATDVDEDDETADEGVDQMDVDPASTKESPVEASDEDRNTTDADTETASEVDDDDVDEVPAPAAPTASAKPNPAARPSRPATRARGAKQPDVAPQAAPDSSGTAHDGEEDDEMPPKRELPFGRRRAAPARKANPPSPPPPAGDETESDDEL